MVQLEILALLTGVIVGALFTFLRFPLPAPTALAGILGVVGIYLGYLLANYVLKYVK